jgi:hypothetical protein
MYLFKAASHFSVFLQIFIQKVLYRGIFWCLWACSKNLEVFLEVYSLCICGEYPSPLILQDQHWVAIWFSSSCQVPDFFKWSELENCRLWVYDFYFYFEEPPVLTISKTSKNHRVSWKFEQRMDGFMGRYSRFQKTHNHGYDATSGIWYFENHSYKL